jgi:ParB family chromosome partitioning protein
METPKRVDDGGKQSAERQALGRGLSALLGVADAGSGTAAEVEQIPAAMIEANPYQPRRAFDDESMRELTESIRAHGLLQPIVVRRGGESYQIIAGERRLRAARLAGLERVPALVRECSDDQALALALIENLQREELSPMEAAHAYRRLQEEFGLKQEEIASRVGKSRSAVANVLRLLHLDPEVQARLDSGAITEGHARALLTVEDPAAQRRLCDRLIDERASVRDAERMVREVLPPPSPLPPENPRGEGGKGGVGRADPHLSEVEAALRAYLGTRVTIARGRSRGTIVVEFYGDEDLTRLAALLLHE